MPDRRVRAKRKLALCQKGDMINERWLREAQRTTGADLALVQARATANEELETMAATWHPEEDATPTPADVESMACVLEGRHGFHAVDVAEFFSTFHSLGGDAGRCWAWAGVAETIRKREKQRYGSITKD